MKLFISALTAAVSLVLCVLGLRLPARAAVVTDTVNVQYFDRNVSGDGYTWDNRNSVLTLDGLQLRTDSPYGMRIPDGATVILKGNTSISAAYAALAVEGEVTFKGDGTLTLTGGSYGLYGYSTGRDRIARYLATGLLTVRAGEACIRFDYAKFYAEAGARLDLSVTGESGTAVSGVTVKLLDCTLRADAPLQASVLLVIQNADVTVTAASAALDSPRSLSLAYMKLQTGDSAAGLAPAEEYGGEAVIRLTPTGREGRGSRLFGAGCPAFVDYLVLAAVVLAVGAAIALPVCRQKKKDRAARAARLAAAAPAPAEKPAAASRKPEIRKKR